jgi:hypothetical protein
MVTARKRMPSVSPHKIQVDITSFTEKKMDNKPSPRRSYAQAASINQYEVLSDKEDDDNDTQMEDVCDSSEDTQITANAQVTQSPEGKKDEGFLPAQSKKTQ